MKTRCAGIPVLALTTATLLASAAFANDLRDKLPKPDPAPTFAAPVRLKAGDAFMGHKRLYPSPVFHDVNGDGLADVVIGDLWGKITVALRVKGDGPPQYAAETKLEGADGKELDFANW
jgi:hypothetical protein